MQQKDGRQRGFKISLIFAIYRSLVRVRVGVRGNKHVSSHSTTGQDRPVSPPTLAVIGLNILHPHSDRRIPQSVSV